MKNASSYTYYKRLSRAARWFMPPREARELMEDYREMLAGMDDATAVSRFGMPVRAVLAAAGKRDILSWHGVFLGLVVLLILPAVFVLSGVGYPIMLGMFTGHMLAILLLVWFGMGGRGRGAGRLSNALLGSFCLLSVLDIVLCAVILYFSTHIFASSGLYLGWMLRVCLVLYSIVGIAGVALARISDRRWSAVAVLSAAGIAVCAYILGIICSMDPTSDPAVMLNKLWFNSVLVTAAGILTAVVSLC